MQRQLPMLMLFVSGLIMLLDYYFPRLPAVHGAREVFLNWGRIALTCAMFLGILNLVFSNFKKVVLRSPGWAYNLVLLGSFLFTFFYAVQYRMVMKNGMAVTLKGTDLGTMGFKIFVNVYTPLSATMFALVAFFIASAAFRAFRAKNFEATLLLVSAGLVMLGTIPVADAYFARLGLERFLGPRNLSWLSYQIQSVPMTAAQRAINLGVGIGIVVISIKILLGIDRSYFGGGD